MFKKFGQDSLSQRTQLKTSVARGIRSAIVSQYPQLEPYIDDILPKKGALIQVKCANHISLITANKEILFYQERDGPFFPTLRVLHAYPLILPKVQVDTGAIKFVMSGANVMCPGLTSKGGRLEEDFKAGTIVAIMAEGHEVALAIGVAKMSRDEIISTNKGIGLDLSHYLDDGLWQMTTLE